ncbi:hypothetical protein BC567DRAFT_224151 [Phyllosticta citribraziliensis]
MTDEGVVGSEEICTAECADDGHLRAPISHYISSSWRWSGFHAIWWTSRRARWMPL